MTLLQLSHIGVTVTDGQKHRDIISDVNLEVEPHDFLTIGGPSGSGKSTLLSVAALLLRPSRGEVTLAGEDLASAPEISRERARRKNVGLVLQQPNLLPTLSTLENVVLPTRGLIPLREARERAKQLLSSTGMEAHASTKARSLSGGEAQRVALCRALVNDAKLLLCDEPTGALDAESAATVLNLLEKVRAERGCAVVMVTHDQEIWARGTRRARISGGGKLEVE